MSMREPQQITTTALDQLKTHVQCRLAGQIRDFRLLVADLGLVLRGRSHTYYAKQLAQHAVMQATELPISANEIDVC